MNHKYLIVKKDGSIEDPEQYIKKSCIDKDLRILIEREALGVKASKKEKKPDYLKYANKMGFNWEKNADIGFVNYNHKADLIKRLVKEYSRMLVNNIGFPIYEISGSNFFDMEHPVVKSYANLYSERLFKHKQGRKEYLMLYDASYPQFNLASDYQLSHKNLPFAHFSISDCYRYEQRGECMLLFRGRRFNMPDLHPYLKNIDEAFEWYFKIEEQILSGVKELNHNFVNVIKVSAIKSWKEYKDKIVNIPVKSKKDMLVEIRMDGVDRYWIIDAMEQPSKRWSFVLEKY